MIVAWKYKERNTLFQKLDPRARLIFMLVMLFSIINFWDMRYLAFFFVIALAQYILSRVTFRDTRNAWLVLGPVLLLLTVFTFLTGRSGEGVYDTQTLITEWHLWRFTIPVTAEKTAFALAQLIRLFSMALFAIVIPYTLDPSKYGVTFRGLKLPDKFAYAMDLAFRLVPTLGRDFSITYDAQRARGYELEKLKGGLIAQIRKMAPLLVPVVIQSIINGEEVIDAMDLRAFGVGPRTWLPKLTYQWKDRLLIAFSVLILLGSYTLSIAGYGKFWIPQFILNLAGG